MTCLRQTCSLDTLVAFAQRESRDLLRFDQPFCFWVGHVQQVVEFSREDVAVFQCLSRRPCRTFQKTIVLLVEPRDLVDDPV